jgi:transcriptional regulator with XRE-family HTH domain
MNLESWATRELDKFRHTPEYELDRLLLETNELIVARMDSLGWRKADLAQRLGVSRAFVTKLLGGNENITLATLVKVANVLGVKVQVDLLPRHVAESIQTAEFYHLEDFRASYSLGGMSEVDQIATAA